MDDQKAFARQLDDITAQQLEKVQAWQRDHGRKSVPVLVGPPPRPEDFEEGEEPYDDRDIEFTHDGPWLSGNDGDPDRRALIRLGLRRRVVDLDKVQVHPHFALVAGFAPVKETELEFPPPECVYCDINLEHDGDGWACPQCRADWASDGYSHHRRVCVEAECDGDEAKVVGEDGQPRCRPCQFLVTVERIEPTGPYRCRETYCRDEKVTGMPADTRAARNRRCGRHQQQIDNEESWKNYLDRKGSTTGSC